MSAIRVLEPHVAAQIAAGEVVERPASVVKELLENALDAGAHRIDVELEEGGIALIAVTDDGCGMTADDAVLAFRRHATSKIGAVDDLDRLRTLGFRGEALPSIAAVAHVRLLTRPEGQPAGTEVTVEGGGPPQAAPAGAAPGTRVEVREIFAATPARRKALRAVRAELAACQETVTDVALAHPETAITLRHQGRELLRLPGTGELRDAAAAVWGLDLARQLLRAGARDSGVEIVALVGPPALARASRSHERFAVNGRPVRADGLRGAMEAAYRGLLTVHRHPVAVCQVRCDPTDVDANVHPRKLEVRFRSEEAVRGLLHRAVRAALAGERLIPDVAAPQRSPRPFQSSLSDWGAARTWTREPEAAYTVRQPAGSAAAEVASGAEALREPGPDGAGSLPPLRAIGQVAATYLVAEGPDGLYLLDQHAAHERVFFESLESSAGPANPAGPADAAGAANPAGPADAAGGENPAGPADTPAPAAPPDQPLAAPLALRLDPGEWAVWARHADAVRGLGFDAGDVGDGTLLLRAVPAGADAAAPARSLLDLLDRLRRDPGPAAESPARRARRALAACKAAVKANQTLSAPEQQALLDLLAGCRDPYTCPHGRPTVLRLGRAELERHFRRT